jgi:hypothetical protein
MITRQKTLGPARFPRGSFTIAADGRIVVSTLPGSFPREKMEAIGLTIVGALASAREAGNPFTEIAADYAGLEIRARDLAGGAVVFITPEEF